MRICFVSREYPPVTSYSGGIGFHYRAISMAVARAGAQAEVITLGEGRDERLESEGVRVHRVPVPPGGRSRVLRDALWARAIDAAIREDGPFDAVYAPEWAGEASRYSRAQTAGPLITNLTSSVALVMRSSPGFSARRRVRLALQEPLERRQAQRSRMLVAVSQAILERLRAMWEIDDVPTVVIPNCVDVSATRRLAGGDPPEAFPADGPVVAFSGRLQAHKGVDVLVGAMSSVWARVPEARLVLLGADAPAGRGWMGERLAQLAGEHRDRLHVLGLQPRERLFPALARADVVALPSRWDAFPLAAVEAMALGRPQVLTEGTGFEEVAGHEAARFVPVDDAVALGAAIADLLEDAPARRRLGEAGSARAGRFDVEPIARRHLELFEAVAADA